MDKFEIEFYQTDNGREPAKEFLDSLDVKMRAKMIDMIILLRDNGNELREPYSKFLANGIFELRAKVGTNISRVLYFFYYGKHIVLTNGLIKKSQKTPIYELEKAKKYMKDYLDRKESK